MGHRFRAFMRAAPTNMERVCISPNPIGWRCASGVDLGFVAVVRFAEALKRKGGDRNSFHNKEGSRHAKRSQRFWTCPGCVDTPRSTKVR